jgi:hypothetical protein
MTTATWAPTAPQLQRSHLSAVITLAVLNGLDIVTTVSALRMGAVEANPFANFLLQNHLLWPLKVGLCIFTVCCVIWRERMDMGLSFIGTLLKSFWPNRMRLKLPFKFPFKVPELTPLGVNNAAWLVVGIYCLVIVLNTITVFSYA